MTHHDPPLDPILEPLLETGRIIQPVPDIVRARSLARARATVAQSLSRPSEPMSPGWRRAVPIVLAASVALLVGAAGAIASIAALRGRVPQGQVPEALVRPVALSTVRGPALSSPPSSQALAPPFDSTAKPHRLGRPVASHESYAAELGLLQIAQAAYAGRDFPGALALVAEHGRRFPNGRLAEEREALRVRSLASSGRADEAARAAAAFAIRFPRSALLPRPGRAPR